MLADSTNTPRQMEARDHDREEEGRLEYFVGVRFHGE
jgi:hypothetical protein